MKSDGRRKREVEEEERQRNIKKPSEGRGKERRDTNVLIRRQNQAGLGGLPSCIDDPAPFTPLLDPLHTVCTHSIIRVTLHVLCTTVTHMWNSLLK